MKYAVGTVEISGMKTDKQIYSIFAANPEWVFELTGLQSPGPCKLMPVALKAIEQNSDAVIFPESLESDLFVLEFQFQFDREIYTRVSIEMALIQQKEDYRSVQGIILFLHSGLDPRTKPWCDFVHAFSLVDLLENLAQRQPKHPLVAVFRPVLMESEETLEKHAGEYYNQILTSEFSDELRLVLLNVFVNWLEQRLKDKGKAEIEMILLGELPDLRETRSGQDLIQIGRQEGKIEGKIEGKRETLLGQLTAKFGRLDDGLRTRIEGIGSFEQLEKLLMQVLTIESPDQLKW